VTRQRTDHHALWHDLLRLGILTKDTLDQNKLEGALSFQIHGFHVTFFLTRLRHDGMYIMQKIGEMTFPRSLEELTTFVNLKNMRTLLRVSEAFWRTRVSLSDTDHWETKRRLTHLAIYSLIDGRKDRHRLCSLRLD
jgi:hypothetical protein